MDQVTYKVPSITPHHRIEWMPCMMPTSEVPTMYNMGEEVAYPYEFALALTVLESVQFTDRRATPSPNRSPESAVAPDQPLSDRLSRYSWIVRPKTAHTQEFQQVYLSIEDTKAADKELGS